MSVLEAVWKDVSVLEVVLVDSFEEGCSGGKLTDKLVSKTVQVLHNCGGCMQMRRTALYWRLF